ncbi:MAG: AraC family transcriptional regulator [Hydrocarboniphaga sp.]|uniref:AraC family transcriptional regulator n=1 Tax=Hydrocarboniphaga sp. TaxID=2033016 RepID=UPI00261403A5|nr:AraC family transcriptional regulator [Hydrocarboniphaga sp.]MDB5967971.1 AraC family transcriptional regulator [Hydrocarboniphaga sp.]
MDLLSEILSSVHIENTFFGCLKLTAPWGFTIPLSSTAHFLCVTAGRCWLSRNGEPPRRLNQGDFVMFTRGGMSNFTSEEYGKPQPVVELIQKHYRPDYRIDQRDIRPFVIHEGGGGEATDIVGGAIDLPGGLGDVLVNALPESIHLSSHDPYARQWLEPLMNLIVGEVDMAMASSGAQGHQAISKRLADLLFLRIIQTHWLQRPEDTSGWLRGLADPKICKVLQAIHSAPQKAWTLESLADKSGMSRSALAGRFLELIGEPPIQYLTRWRMHLAAIRLAGGERRTALIAEQLGYQSDIAFSKAFKRVRGISPGAYRRSLMRAQGLPRESA